MRGGDEEDRHAPPDACSNWCGCIGWARPPGRPQSCMKHEDGPQHREGLPQSAAECGVARQPVGGQAAVQAPVGGHWHRVRGSTPIPARLHRSTSAPSASCGIPRWVARARRACSCSCSATGSHGGPYGIRPEDRGVAAVVRRSLQRAGGHAACGGARQFEGRCGASRVRCYRGSHAQPKLPRAGKALRLQYRPHATVQPKPRRSARSSRGSSTSSATPSRRGPVSTSLRCASNSRGGCSRWPTDASTAPPTSGRSKSSRRWSATCCLEP